MTAIQNFERNNPDIGPLSEIWKLHYKALVNYAKRIIQNDLEAEDIATQAFERLIYADALFDNSISAKSFLFITARNLCYDYFRTKNIHDRIHAEIADQSAMILAMQQGDDYNLMYAEYIQILYLEMRSLPPACKNVFTKIFFDKKSTSEIAEELGISVQTVRNQKAKAVELLKSAMLKKDLKVALLFFQLILMAQKNEC